MWNEITYPFPNYGCTVEVWEWISNFIPHFTGHVITNYMLSVSKFGDAGISRYSNHTGLLYLNNVAYSLNMHEGMFFLIVVLIIGLYWWMNCFWYPRCIYPYYSENVCNLTDSATTLTGDPLHSRAACTQPCNVNTHSRAHCSPAARLCEQWGTAVCKCPAV